MRDTMNEIINYTKYRFTINSKSNRYSQSASSYSSVFMSHLSGIVHRDFLTSYHIDVYEALHAIFAM